jgi:hypothetical protein
LQKDKASYFSFPIKIAIGEDTAICFWRKDFQTFLNLQHKFHHFESHISAPKCQIQANMGPH